MMPRQKQHKFYFKSKSRPRRKQSVNHEDFDDVKKIKPWIMSVIIKKGENVNLAYLDDVEKKSLDYHHKKGGECECINT